MIAKKILASIAIPKDFNHLSMIMILKPIAGIPDANASKNRTEHTADIHKIKILNFSHKGKVNSFDTRKI